MSKKLTLEFIQSKFPNQKIEEIKTLNLWGNELEDISILSKLSNLEIASLSINKIKNLEPLKDLTNLKELYLRKNLVDDIKQIENLKNLQNLKILSLVDNPVVSLPNYKKKVLEIFPNLIKLDDINIKNENSNNKNKNQIIVNKNSQNNILTDDTFKKNEKENNNNNNGNNKNENKQTSSHILSIRKNKGNIGGFKKYSTSKKDDETLNNNLGDNKLLQSMNLTNFQTEFNRSQYRKKIVGKSFQTDNSPNKLLQSQVIIHSKFFEDEKDKGSSSEEKNLLNQYKSSVTHDLNLGHSIKQVPYVKKSTINNNEAVFQSIKILLSTLNKPYLLEVQNEVNKLLGK
jgi:hypothetical protein